MSDSYDLDQPDMVVADAVGEPGRRTFYLQARQGTTIVSLKLEKQQVAALCDYLEGLLHDLPAVSPAEAGPLSLVEPVLEAWPVGSLAVAYEEAADRILIVAEELTFDDEDDDTARLHLRREQVAALVAHGNAVVSQGRPPCPLCGRAIDPDGHHCPRLN
jgi:uncharacterized repeat protein (TIGR03847 family)